MGDPLLVKDLMTAEVHTLGRNEKLRLADDLMRMERIRHLPVLDDDGDVAGIVSQRDLFRSALARVLGYGQTAQDKLMDMLLVKEVMTNQVESVAPDVPAAEAAQRMTDAKLGCLVVIADGKLAGILTESDFVRHVASQG